jgi:Cu(I)-responsive transcriptional regulator
MNIGNVADLSGLPAKTIRYYEDIGLIRPRRGPNGSRAFAESDVHKLAFLARARSLGFTIEACRALFALYEDTGRSSADVTRLAEAHLAAVDRKIAGLAAMRATLARLVDACHGDGRPDCPILDDIAGVPAESRAGSKRGDGSERP